MAYYKTIQANQKQVWSTDYATEYTRESGFLPYMGKDITSIIRVDKKLSTERSSTIHFPYFRALNGAGVTGSTVLRGSEDTLNNLSCVVKTSMKRNAVSMPESERYQSELDALNIAKPALKAWSANLFRSDLITALQSVPVVNANDSDGNPTEDSYVAYASASAGQLNAFCAANADRVLFGNTRSNATGTMSTSLANVAATQTMGSAIINLARTLARTTTNYRISPYRSDATAGREYFVLFVGPEGYRDAAIDPVIYAANKDARPRDLDTNPIFQSGDLIYNGVIIREIPEMPVVGNVGASNARVGHALLCGQSAAAVAYSMMATPTSDNWDYDDKQGVGIKEIRGQSKFSVAGVQTGMVSVFHAAAQ